MNRIKFLGFKVWLPGHWILRSVMGLILVFGGFLGFLPVLGFWMLPLGLIILSIDFPMIRRFRRWITVRLGLVLHRKWPNFARRVGLTTLRGSR